jgi:hypothetical protein
MPHCTDQYADRLNELLHYTLTPTYFYKQEIVEVPGLLTAILVTYDGVHDDHREVEKNMTWEGFRKRMSAVDPDWLHFDRSVMEELSSKHPEKVMGGCERRTIYLIKGGSHADQWTPEKMKMEVTSLLMSTWVTLGITIQAEVEHLREHVPLGFDHFQQFEHMVRVTFNFLFRPELGEGRPQSRTEPEDEGIEIRDLLFSNNSNSGFWKDLKDKYSASEIVVDAKNKDKLTRDDLRQLYCYLKPALGFWGFVVCRSEQPAWIRAFNRTLFKNFNQKRGLLILCDDDLRRMVQMKNRGQEPTEYLRERMAEFIRSI